MASSWKTCPRCRFLLEATATSCRFCGADLTAPVVPPTARLFAAPSPSAPPLPPPGASAPRGRDGLWSPRAAAGVAAVALLIASIGGAVARGGDTYPDHWDPRVVDLVAFVEDQRDLDFEHPVAVDFLTTDEYSERTRTGEDELTTGLREDLAHYEGLYRALGLLPAGADLFEAGNTLTDEGTLAFYDPEDERVVVRGTTLTVDLRVTLVHELTHVLQDQHFDIERLVDTDSSGAAFAARALMEGDAERIEERYVELLPASEREDYETALPADPEDAGLGSVPVSLLALFGAPYQFGRPFVVALEATGGDRAVDDAFRSLPTSEEQILDPVAYLGGDEPEAQEMPDIGEAEVIDEDDFGSVVLLLFLAERIDARQALQAVDGWRGDAYVGYEREGRVCLTADFAADTTLDLRELLDAVKAWAAQMPEGAAEVREHDGQVELTSCDPGAEGAVAPTGTGMDGLVLAEARSYLIGSALRAGANNDQARCMGQHVVDALTIGQLNGSEELPEGAVAGAQRAAAGACGFT